MSNDQQQLMLEEHHLIIKAIWDYNEIFRRRFNTVLSHVYSKKETCAVPIDVLSSTVQFSQGEPSEAHEIAKLFFFAYSALLDDSRDETTTAGEEQLDIIFGEEGLIEQIAHHYIVCLFLPHQDKVLERLKLKFPTLYQSKESGMIWRTSLPSSSLFETQLEIMKTKHKWTLENIGKDVRVFSFVDWESLNHGTGDESMSVNGLAQKKRVILKTATDNFQDFCKYFEITCEFASGQQMNSSLRKYLLNVYSNQIQVERKNGKQLSDYVIVLENDEIASAGMILYGNELESDDYKEHSNCAAIYSIATRDQYRGRGYATMVVITLMELAKSKGYDRVILHASESGCSLYSKLGFEKKVSIDVCSIALFLDK